MLTYSVLGPRPNGMYIVGYPTPGCAVFTAAMECSSRSLADSAADSMNREQSRKEEEAQLDKAMRNLRCFHVDSEPT